MLLLPVVAKRLWASRGSIRGAVQQQNQSTKYAPIVEDENQAFLKPDDEGGGHPAGRSSCHRFLIEEPMINPATAEGHAEGRLNIRETAWLSFEFCILWVCPDSRW